MPWRRRRADDVAPLIDVHERDTAAGRPAVPEEEYAAVLVASITYREKARRVGRDYGRASATIHALRAECALLREDLAVHREDAALRECQLTEANRRASDAEQRAADLRDEVARRRPETDVWDALRPGDVRPPLHHDYVCAAVVMLADEVPLSCNRPRGHAGQHVATGADTVLAVRPADLAGGGETVVGSATPGDTTLADNIVDAVEQLARYLAAVAMPDVEWREDRAAFKDTYRAYAWAVASVGWRPPVVLAAPDRVATVARVLTDHELLADDTCRCGWGCACVFTSCREHELWHAEHVAQQCVSLGVLG